MTRTGSTPERVLRVWPTIAGVAFAAGLVVILRLGIADSSTAADVLAAAAFVYLGSAALGHRSAAWPLFALTFVLIGVGLVLEAFSAVWVMIVVATGLTVYGFVRGRARPGWGLPLQLLAMFVVIAVVVVAALLPGPWSAVLAGIGLVVHAGWDAHHLRTGRVVAATMAEFCAALDVCLAVGVIVLAVAA